MGSSRPGYISPSPRGVDASIAKRCSHAVSPCEGTAPARSVEHDGISRGLDRPRPAPPLRGSQHGEAFKGDCRMGSAAFLLEGIELGDPATAEQLLPLLYDDLRRLAAFKLAREKAGQTFD